MGKTCKIKTGYIPMTADLFHIGHLRAIRQCKKYCDYLVVGLLDCPKYKKTIIPYNQREEILLALPEVDLVVKQKTLKMKLKGIDYVFSGDGWEADELKEIQKYGCKAVNIDYCEEQSTSKIKNLLK